MMMKGKKPEEMSLEELLEAEKSRNPLTEDEKKEQISALALAEARLLVTTLQRKKIGCCTEMRTSASGWQ